MKVSRKTGKFKARIASNSIDIEPLAKVVSGDFRPHCGAILSWNFGKWNHHSPHSNSKSHSKWDSSTQTFVSGSIVQIFNAEIACFAYAIANHELFRASVSKPVSHSP